MSKDVALAIVWWKVEGKAYSLYAEMELSPTEVSQSPAIPRSRSWKHLIHRPALRTSMVVGRATRRFLRLFTGP